MSLATHATNYVAGQQSLAFYAALLAPPRARAQAVGKALAEKPHTPERSDAVAHTHSLIHALHAARDAAWIAALAEKGAASIVLDTARQHIGLAPLHLSDANARKAWPTMLPEDRYLSALQAACKAALDLSHPNRRPDLALALRRLLRALEAVVKDGENLCHYMVADLTSRGRWQLPKADLLQEARMGLVTAACRFDPCKSKGGKFRTFACTWIRARVGRAEKNLGRTIRVPVGALGLSAKIDRYLANNPGASNEDIAAHLGVSVTTIAGVRENVSRFADAMPTHTVDGNEVLHDGVAPSRALRCLPALTCDDEVALLEEEHMHSVHEAISAARDYDSEAWDALTARRTQGTPWADLARNHGTSARVLRRRAGAVYSVAQDVASQ